MDAVRTGERDGAARLRARPRTAGSVSSGGPVAGLHAVDLGGGPEVLVYVPANVETGRLTLVIALHGAGGNAEGGLAPLQPLADSGRLLLLAPTAQHRTWDVIRGGWGPDVRRIDRALEKVFAAYPVDATRIAVSGFSDGATYALSLGLANADLLTHVIAFSPGFVARGPRVGTPEVFIAHGRHDTVLPIDHTTRRIVRHLRADGVPTEVREFDGPHAIPAAIATDAVDWLLRTPPAG